MSDTVIITHHFLEVLGNALRYQMEIRYNYLKGGGERHSQYC